MTAESQMARIAALQGGGALSVGAGAAHGGERRESGETADAAFILETVDPLPASEVAVRMARDFPGLRFDVTPLFDEDAPTFFGLRFKSVRFADLHGSPFELAHLLACRSDIASAEPDLTVWSFRSSRGGRSADATPAETRGGSLWPNDPGPDADCSGGEGVVVAVIGVADRAAGGGGAARRGSAACYGGETLNVGVSAHRLGWTGVGRFAASDFYGDTHGPAGAAVHVAVRRSGVEASVVSAIAPRAQVIEIAASNERGSLSLSEVSMAIDEARGRNAHVILIGVECMPSRALYRAIDLALDDNVMVFALGQPNDELFGFPASHADLAGLTALCAASAPDAFNGFSDVDEAAVAAGVAARWLSTIDRSAIVSSLAVGEMLQRRFRNVVTRHACAQARLVDQRVGTGATDFLGPYGRGGEGSAGEEAPGGENAVSLRRFPIAAAVAPLLNEIADKQGAQVHFRQDDPELDRFGQEIIWRRRTATSVEPAREGSMSSALQRRLTLRSDFRSIL